MTNLSSSTHWTTWQQQPYEYFIKGEYTQAANLYEQAITADPDVKSYYWYLGLILLVQGQEAEAQMTWLVGMSEGEPEQIELWTVELINILQEEATRREALADYSVAWAIRNHLKEIEPNAISNLLQIIQLSLKLKMFAVEELSSIRLLQLLQLKHSDEVNSELLLEVLQNILNYAPLEPITLEFTEACLPYVPSPQAFINVILPASMNIAYRAKQPTLAARFADLCLRLDDKNVEVLRHQAAFYQNSRDYDKGIQTAKLCFSLVQTLPEKVFAIHLVLRGLMNAGGYWEEVKEVFQIQESLLLELIAENPTSLDQATTLRLFTPTFFQPYYRDDLKNNRWIQNQVSRICQTNIENYAKKQKLQYQHKRQSLQSSGTKARTIKIGYLSHCFSRHSVGFLARWLFQYHDKENFEINAYLINHKLIYDPLQEAYINQASKTRKLGMDGLEIAEKVYQDEIDILVDLDSITLDISCEAMALKPAPVQVTWLGWDASGLPAIDYFIADPYVLPESAQESYIEKIWRLPQTYIAVDGFEVGVPTLRRDQLDIPSDAVVYLSGQRGYKRHPDTARLQMKIIKEVPNSYFLIKGLADDEAIKKLFTEIAEEEGVNCDRLRFLPEVALEAIHRANLGIADVILDTYPYNGATTTLETLWMGIPLVTRAGQQFAARNSYTMMMNAGITEGIAWTDEEYVEWGICLGKDSILREQISWRMRQSRQTSPLWNAKQFTREMENAYEQMWKNYLLQQS